MTPGHRESAFHAARDGGRDANVNIRISFRFELHRVKMGCLAQAMATVLLATPAPVVAAAPAYPVRPVRLLVGFSPGGGTDIAVRIIGRKLSELWGQQIVVDNRPGAGGLIAFDMAAKATPDGYTLLASSPSFAIQPNLHRKLPYDPVRDITPVTAATAAPYLLVVYPGLEEARTVKDLVSYARAHPGRLNYASGGVGSAQHLAAELFANLAGIELVHVPFRGAVNIPEIIAGRVQLLMSGLPQGLPHVRAGRLRALGVTTRGRSRALPEVPAIAEAGVPGYDVTIWYGIFVTGGTPAAIVQRIHAGFVEALRTDEVIRQLRATGLEPVGSPQKEFAAQVRAETGQWGEVIRRAGIRPQ